MKNKWLRFRGTFATASRATRYLTQQPVIDKAGRGKRAEMFVGTGKVLLSYVATSNVALFA